MTVAMAHIKLQTWEWIPDLVASACHYVVYDPDAIMPVRQGLTDINGYKEFDVPPGVYVIWVYGHNPMGYRPFLADTWVPIAVLPGQTQEVCAALVSLIDIPALYALATGWARWEPDTFAKVLGTYSEEMLKECNATAPQQQRALEERMPGWQDGVAEAVEPHPELRDELLHARREWGKQAMAVAKKHGRDAVAQASRAAEEAVARLERDAGPRPVGPCAEQGGVVIDWSQQAPGPLLYLVVSKVEFTQMLETVGIEEHVLRLTATSGKPPFRARVMGSFGGLECGVHRITLDLHNRGGEAEVDGMRTDKASGGYITVNQPVDPGHQHLVLDAGPDERFVNVRLSGQELDCSRMLLE